MDTKFLDDYWYYLGALNQIVTLWQETRTMVDALNDKVTAFIDREEFLVKFLEDDNSVREVDLVTAEVTLASQFDHDRGCGLLPK